MNRDAAESKKLSGDDEWGIPHGGLSCRISCSREIYPPGEVIAFELQITNTGNTDIMFPLRFFDKDEKHLVIGGDETSEAPGLFLLVRGDEFGSLEFDNFGYQGYLPDPTYINLSSGDVLTKTIAIDNNSTFAMHNGERIELFGGYDHCGLKVQGRYFLKVKLKIPKTDAKYWHGHIESNEISIVVKEDE